MTLPASHASVNEFPPDTLAVINARSPARGLMTDLATNVLSYGDNLDILRRYLPDAAVDLVELDPPFNSNRDYNVIFRDESGSER
jgi:hypothetical protein